MALSLPEASKYFFSSFYPSERNPKYLKESNFNLAYSHNGKKDCNQIICHKNTLQLHWVSKECKLFLHLYSDKNVYLLYAFNGTLISCKREKRMYLIVKKLNFEFREGSFKTLE